MVEDFGVAILPSADHWWAFHDTESLGAALAEAGHLVVGYGMPWLAHELIPPDRGKPTTSLDKRIPASYHDGQFSFWRSISVFRFPVIVLTLCLFLNACNFPSLELPLPTPDEDNIIYVTATPQPWWRRRFPLKPRRRWRRSRSRRPISTRIHCFGRLRASRATAISKRRLASIAACLTLATPFRRSIAPKRPSV